MVIGIGTDIIEVDRIKKAAEHPRFVQKTYTDKEQQYFHDRKDNPQVMAGNFAAKEAVAKALSSGFRGFSLTDVEILRDELGKPYVILHGGAARQMEELEASSLHVSISHTKDYAIAYALLEQTF